MTEQHAAPKVHTRDARDVRDRDDTLRGTETKASFKTTELIFYILAVVGVLIASAIVDNNFGADPAWRYVTYLTIGYMISRGLAKAGSRNPVAVDTAFLHLLGLQKEKSLIWQECAERQMPGADYDLLNFPLLDPAALRVTDFQAPDVLLAVSFNPLRMLASAVRRLLARM